MGTKICKICKIEKDYSEFHKIKNCIGGVRTVCKECRKEEKKEYNLRDYVIEKNKTFYQDHKVRIRKYFKEYYWTITSQYHQYKKSAKKRNLVFELTENDCLPYYNTKCYYCGGDIKGIGIDRVDNKRGYTFDNIVPCCSNCNFMKHALSKDEFLQHIKNIIKHLKL
jgi:hypothetical protein